MVSRMLIVALALLCIPAGSRAGDIVLTLDNDVSILLHDNHRWSCTDESSKRKVSDMTITLEDGQLVKLSGKGTWSFVGSGAKPDDGLARIYHTGVGRSTSADSADQIANKFAMDGLVARLRTVVGGKASETDLRDCVAGMEKRVERQESFAKGLHEVRIKITMERAAIDGVKECAALSKRLDAKDGAPADSAP